MSLRAKCALGVVMSLAAAFGVAYVLMRPAADVRAFADLRSRWNALPDDADAVADFHRRCLAVSREHAGTKGGAAALLLASTVGDDADVAAAVEGLIATGDGGVLAASLDLLGHAPTSLKHLAGPILSRVNSSPGLDGGGRLLAFVCVLTFPAEGAPPGDLYRQAADLLAEKHADHPGVNNFCEGLGGHSLSPPWAFTYERHLRLVAEGNPGRAERCAASFALAAVQLVAPDDRQEEAEKLFAAFVAEFDGTYRYPYQGIEQNYLTEAKQHLAELRHRAVGRAAPELSGLDLDGKELSLGDYRGRAVLLNFWGTWCFPCMKLIPHERGLAMRHCDDPFQPLGVNCDTDLDKARAAVARTGMTWPSLRNEQPDGGKITKAWNVLGFPALYLIDHHGVIRKRWVGAPPGDELDRAVKVIVDAAREQVSAEGMSAVVKELANTVAAPETTGVDVTKSGTFRDRVHRTNGAKYVVFVPHGHDTSKPSAALLYLHGAGPRGDDGKAHVATGLAKMIRDHRPDFPLVVVFPQARPGEDWLTGGAGAKRALACLDEAAKDFNLDADRVALSGASMGGAGTWSLAAAEPARWSAIVPICHGGDGATAARIKGIPCWCFHGAADKVIPPQQSRDMIVAITEAGGRPLYREMEGVGHDDCAGRAFASKDVVEWLLMQRR